LFFQVSEFYLTIKQIYGDREKCRIKIFFLSELRISKLSLFQNIFRIKDTKFQVHQT